MKLAVNTIHNMDCLAGLKMLDDNSIDCCVTSPPYYQMRDYGVQGQIGLEKMPDEYVQKLVEVFAEVKRVLKPTGTMWLNIGDCYAGSGGMGSFIDSKAKKGMIVIKQYSRHKTYGKIKPKDLMGIPWTLAFALRDDGWYLRQDIIWHKPNPLPESVRDRCTKAHEYIFLLAKSPKYYYDYEAMLEPATGYDGRKDTRMKGSKKYSQEVVPGQRPHTFATRGHERWKFKNLRDKGQPLHTMHLKRLEGEEYLSPVRNKRSVWTVPTQPFKGAHFAVFPLALITPCILAGCPVGGIVLDPFMGASTTALAALQNNRNFIGFELNPEYVKIAEERLQNVQLRMV